MMMILIAIKNSIKFPLAHFACRFRTTLFSLVSLHFAQRQNRPVILYFVWAGVAFGFILSLNSLDETLPAKFAVMCYKASLLHMFAKIEGRQQLQHLTENFSKDRLL